MANKLFWSVVLVAAGLYGVMLFWSLPVLLAASGNLRPFDLRPWGYTYQEALTLLAALGARGITFYRTVQLTLDTAFPLFESLATGWAILRLAPPRWGRWRLALALIVLPGMGFDYLENAAIARMLDLGPTGLNASLVARASQFSQMKALFVALAMSLLLALIALWGLRLFRTTLKSSNATVVIGQRNTYG